MGSLPQLEPHLPPTVTPHKYQKECDHVAKRIQISSWHTASAHIVSSQRDVLRANYGRSNPPILFVTRSELAQHNVPIASDTWESVAVRRLVSRMRRNSYLVQFLQVVLFSGSIFGSHNTDSQTGMLYVGKTLEAKDRFQVCSLLESPAKL